MDDLTAYVTCRCGRGQPHQTSSQPLSSTSLMWNGQAWVRFQHHYVTFVHSLSRVGVYFSFFTFFCRHVIWTSVKPNLTVVWHCTISARPTAVRVSLSKWSCASDGFKREPNSCVNPPALLCVGPQLFVCVRCILQLYVMQKPLIWSKE
jgi:hypothetical protein